MPACAPAMFHGPPEKGVKSARRRRELRDEPPVGISRAFYAVEPAAGTGRLSMLAVPLETYSNLRTRGKGERTMSESMTVLLVIAAIAGIGVLWYISTMNRFARLVVKIAEADSGIDVGLTKRHDTLTKMLDVTKAYARHESETLARLVTLRKGMNMGERIEVNRQMDEVAGKISLMAEAYPELRSSENFRELQKSVVEVEEHLQAARRIYNMNVSAFNQLLVSFPSSIVGRQHNHTAKEFFEADEQKKEDVKMEF